MKEHIGAFIGKMLDRCYSKEGYELYRLQPWVSLWICVTSHGQYLQKEQHHQVKINSQQFKSLLQRLFNLSFCAKMSMQPCINI